MTSGVGDANGTVEAPAQPAHTRAATVTVDALFAIAVVLTAVSYFVLTRYLTFSRDDWPLVHQSLTVRGLFEDYNGHLSVVPLALWRFLAEAFGFGSYAPTRVVGVIGICSLAVAMYLIVRARVGVAAALVVGISYLWYRDLGLVPQASNHFFAITAVVVCAWMLPDERPARDVPLAVALSVALASSGAGVAGAVGCLAFLLFTRPRRRRWIALLVPSVVWLVWWFTVSNYSPPFRPRTFSQKISFVFDGLRFSFNSLAVGNAALGAVLIVAFVALLMVRLRHGLRAAANQLAWSTALIFWWAALAYSRGIFSADAFRFRIIGSTFVVLALLPEERPARLRSSEQLSAVLAACVVAALVFGVNEGRIVRRAHAARGLADATRAQLVVANLGPRVVPGTARANDIPQITVSQYRELVRRFGTPPGTRPRDVDGAVVRLLHLAPKVLQVPVPAQCSAIRAPLHLRPDAYEVIAAPDQPVNVELRRFERSWTTVGTVPKGKTVLVHYPALAATPGWQVRARGGCDAGPFVLSPGP